MSLTSVDLVDLSLDWVGRRLYLTYLSGDQLTISVVLLDSLAQPHNIFSTSVPRVTMVDVTLSPYAG